MMKKEQNGNFFNSYHLSYIYSLMRPRAMGHILFFGPFIYKYTRLLIQSILGWMPGSAPDFAFV
jgi:hypothetical protein